MSGVISDTGIWLLRTNHQHDPGLLECLVDKFGGSEELFYDFGCGDAAYAKALIDSGVSVDCYDGNPQTSEITGGLGSVLDLTSDFDYDKRDWVICLEVGEHVPKEHEKKLLDNITKHSKKGVILSWAVIGQAGYGHINCQPNEYIIEEMSKRGFLSYSGLELILRNSITHLGYFTRTVMAFLRI